MKHTQTVLIVEDVVAIAAELAAVLSDIGFSRIRIAHSLPDAEAVVAVSRPDIAVLDVNLGAGSQTIDLGLALQASDTQVIFTSGYAQIDLSPAIAAFPFLEKPVSVAMIQDTIQRFLGQA